MKITNLSQKHLFAYLSSRSSFCVNLNQLGQIWLFNCFEGCQHVLAAKKVKISQIKKIILTDLRVKNISGLIGLLSSLSLNTKIKRIDVYGPVGLSKYLFLSRKYSQTNFRYKLYIYSITKGLIAQQFGFYLYSFVNSYKHRSFNYIIFVAQTPGPFDLNKAALYSIPSGPLFGRLKLGCNFMLPDGCLLNSRSFVAGYHMGSKVVFATLNIQRSSSEFLKNSTYVFSYG